MEGGGRQSRLLSRLLGKLRGEHRFNNIDKSSSFSSTGMDDDTTTIRGGSSNEDGVAEANDRNILSDDQDTFVAFSDDTNLPLPESPPTTSNTKLDDEQFAAKIDLRYGGQYLTPEQLPEFCDQLHNLVQVIRNIQSYAKVTGEYPKTLEERLQKEASEVAALAAEARNAQNVVARTHFQRRAVRAQRKHLATHLASLRETELRELESVVRASDRKLYKSWEALKDTRDPSAFNPLLNEIKNKQVALESLVRLIGNRRSALTRESAPPVLLAQPLPAPPLPQQPRDYNQDSIFVAGASSEYRRESRRAFAKRRRKEAEREPHSMPLSSEVSHHSPHPQVILNIQGADNQPRCRVGSAGAVAVASLGLPSNDDARDVIFFTSN